MQRAVFLHLEQLLRDYPKIDNFIANIQESPYFGLDDEKRIITLKQHKNAIRETIKAMDDNVLEVINSLYFQHDPNKTLEGLAYDLHIAPSSLYYRRNKFLETLCKKIGW